MMKYILTSIFVLVNSLLFAQINVGSNTQYEELLKESVKNNKLVFIDFYTDWCVPCKQMDKEVFASKRIQDYMAEKFIFLKVNAEKGYGIELARANKIKSYPSFVVLKNDGSEYFRFVGLKSVSEFIEIIDKNLDESRSDQNITLRYEAGDRSPSLVKDYLALLRKERKDRDFEIALHQYYISLPDSSKKKEENWFVYSNYTQRFNHPRIKQLISNQSEFEKSIGKDQINSYLLKLGRVELLAYANGNKATKTFNNEENYNFLKEYLISSNIIEIENINALAKIADSRFEFDNGLDALLVVEKEFSNLSLNDKFILMINLPVREGADLDKVNDVQERILLNNLEDLSVDNQKIIKRILDSYVKYELKNGINFENLSFDNVLKESEKSGKLVFVDFYTDWCGPCKALDQNVFPTEFVGNYVNSKFHSLKINAEKGDGIGLRKKYTIQAFPTMLVLDSKGVELGRLVGYKTPKELVEELTKLAK